MGRRIINQLTGQVIPEKNLILECNKLYEYDSGEEALLEIILSKSSFFLGDKTLSAIKNIGTPLEVRGVILPTHFFWRNYIFIEIGRIIGYIGKMDEVESVEPKCKRDENETIQTSVDIYLLFCNETPNIYYVGKSKNIYSRFMNHLANTKNQSPKFEWINYIKKNNLKLEFKILDTTTDENATETEIKYIMQYIEEKQNIVLNFTPPSPYGTSNAVFYHRFKKCLYDKEIVIVDDYTDTSIITKKLIDIERNSSVYALYCDETPNIYHIGFTNSEMNVNELYKTGTCIREWLDYIKKNGYELKYKILETVPFSEAKSKIYYWANVYITNKSNVVLNFNTAHYRLKDKLIISRFKACLYEKKVIIVDDYKLDRGPYHKTNKQKYALLQQEKCETIL